MTLGILASYVIDRSNLSQERSKQLAAAGVPIAWDSGAFSVFTEYADVDVDEHAEWVVEQSEGVTGPLRFLALDVIGDADATLANYRRQAVDHGAKVEPTIHYGDPLDQVDRLLDVAVPEYLNLGGLVPTLTRATPTKVRQAASFIAAVKRRLPEGVKLHVLGCTHPAVGQLVHFDAGDSTRWLAARRSRSLLLFDRRTAEWRSFRVATTDPDVPEEATYGKNRDVAWGKAYKGGAWLRNEYGLSPADLVHNPDSRTLLTASITSNDRFTDWMHKRHNAETIIYLAGAITESIARDWFTERLAAS